MDIKKTIKETVVNAARSAVEDKVAVITQPEKAAAKESNVRDNKDAQRIFDILDAREERIREALNHPDLTPEDETYFRECLEKYEDIREKTKKRMQERKLAERRFEHEINKDIGELDVRRQEAAAKQKQAEAEMLKAKNEKTKALAIAGGALLGVGGMTAAIWHGTNTGAAVEMYQNGALTSTTSKNWCPKFSDVSKIIFAPKV